MDQRKSSSTRGRGRAIRGQRFRPQVASQQHPQSAYYPQPPPPVHPQFFQEQYYARPPPPLNPSQYNVMMTNEFNPFSDYREGPSRREPSVERELPLYDDDDDEVGFVPETQPQTQTGINFYFYTLLFVTLQF